MGEKHPACWACYGVLWVAGWIGIDKVCGVRRGIIAGAVGSFVKNDSVVFFTVGCAAPGDGALIECSVVTYHPASGSICISFYTIIVFVINQNACGAQTGHLMGSGDAEIHGDGAVAAG